MTRTQWILDYRRARLVARFEDRFASALPSALLSVGTYSCSQAAYAAALRYKWDALSLPLLKGCPRVSGARS